MQAQEPNDDGASPLALWRGLIRYYGALVERPGWAHIRPLFDLVKQISTSQSALDFYPTLVGDVLVITRQPLADDAVHQPRLTLEFTEARAFLFKQYEANSLEHRELTCNREQAFNVLAQIVRSL